MAVWKMLRLRFSSRPSRALPAPKASGTTDGMITARCVGAPSHSAPDGGLRGWSGNSHPELPRQP